MIEVRLFDLLLIMIDTLIIILWLSLCYGNRGLPQQILNINRGYYSEGLGVKVLELFCPNSVRSINQTSFRIRRILIKIGLAKRECRLHGNFSYKITTVLHCWIATLNILKSTPGMIMSNLKPSVKPAFNVCSVNDVNFGIYYG